MTKENYWPMFETILREHFPASYTPDDPGDWDYWLDGNEAARDFLSGQNCDDWEKYERLTGIEIVEQANSFYENFDYDSYPQGKEDECFSIVKYQDKFYKIGLVFRSYGGYHFMNTAHEVEPKVKEIIVYE